MEFSKPSTSSIVLISRFLFLTVDYSSFHFPKSHYIFQNPPIRWADCAETKFNTEDFCKRGDNRILRCGSYFSPLKLSLNFSHRNSKLIPKEWGCYVIWVQTWIKTSRPQKVWKIKWELLSYSDTCRLAIKQSRLSLHHAQYSANHLGIDF